MSFTPIESLNSELRQCTLSSLNNFKDLDISSQTSLLEELISDKQFIPIESLFNSQLLTKRIDTPISDFVLGSRSPQRKKLLTLLGIDHLCIPSPLINEFIPDRSSSVGATTQAIALMKLWAFLTAGSLPGSLILTSDSLVECNGIILGKPENQSNPLPGLLGETLHISSSVVMMHMSGKLFAGETTTSITLKPPTPDLHNIVQAYIHEYTNLSDKAGGFGLQDPPFQQLMESLTGDPFAVIGLPLQPLFEGLKLFQVPYNESDLLSLYSLFQLSPESR